MFKIKTKTKSPSRWHQTSVIEIKISTSGLDFNELTNKISGPLKQKLVERLADVAWASAFWGAPHRTGYFASTVTKEVGVGEASVSANASYARFVEEGTRPHEIRPINGRLLVFQVRGKTVFTPLVHHPGTKPNPFMHRAADETRGRVEELFNAVWRELMGA